MQAALAAFASPTPPAPKLTPSRRIMASRNATLAQTWRLILLSNDIGKATGSEGTGSPSDGIGDSTVVLYGLMSSGPYRGLSQNSSSAIGRSDRRVTVFSEEGNTDVHALVADIGCRHIAPGRGT